MSERKSDSGYSIGGLLRSLSFWQLSKGDLDVAYAKKSEDFFDLEEEFCILFDDLRFESFLSSCKSKYPDIYKSGLIFLEEIKVFESEHESDINNAYRSKSWAKVRGAARNLRDKIREHFDE